MIASHLNDFECIVPSSLQEALVAKQQDPSLIPIAGGTEVMVQFNEGLLPPSRLMSLHRLTSDLRYIRHTSHGLSLGALATYGDARMDQNVHTDFPLLVECSKITGAIQIQNRGTFAGNIINASPAADSVPVLIAYDAVLTLQSAKGSRRVPINEFFKGYRKTDLREDEMLTEIFLPKCPAAHEQQYYRKVGTRKAQAISKVVFAGINHPDHVRLVWGSVAPTTIRTRDLERLVQVGSISEDVLIENLLREIAPLDDVRSTKDYRLKVAENILFDFLQTTANFA